MIANCEVLITQYSTVVYTGIVLGKEVHSYFDVEQLRQLAPLQNGGQSGQRIAQVCQHILETETAVSPKPHLQPVRQSLSAGLRTES